MEWFLGIAIACLLSAILGYTLGYKTRDDEDSSLGALVLADDGEGQPYIFLEFAPGTDPGHLVNGSRITLRVREINSAFNGTK